MYIYLLISQEYTSNMNGQVIHVLIKTVYSSTQIIFLVPRAVLSSAY